MTRVERSSYAVAVAPAPAVRTLDACAEAAARASDYLLDLQSPEGFWVGELEADTTLEADYILLQLWLYPPDEEGGWNPPTRRRVDKAARYILERQSEQGGWAIYAGGPDNVSASVKSYCALKLALPDQAVDALGRAAIRVRELGGLEAVNSYTKIYLSYFGLYDRERTPTIPPEIFLLPPSSGFSIYEMSSWSRTILAPLAILGANKASRAVPPDFDLDEIRSGHEPVQPEFFSWKNFFLWLDRALKVWENSGFLPVREQATKVAADWMIERLQHSDGLSAIFPAMMNSIMALTELGYGLDDPLLRDQIEKFDRLILEEEASLRLQPCHSPIWDTALSCYALGVANPAPDERTSAALERGADWLLSKEVRMRGDWAVKNPDTEPGGWYFEYENEFYPDTDDTAKVLLSLEYARSADGERQQAVRQRALDWLVSMQCRDGGWGAFDIDNDSQILTHVPFADHNAMLDPTCADLTGRALEALCGPGGGRERATILRGIEYLKSRQEADGSWYGRWGVNYIYGTCFALRGLSAAGESPDEPYIRRARDWLRSIQKADGGWGESCASYEDPRNKVLGDSTASQTAWALLALFASGEYESEAVEKGLTYLIETQNPDGSWDEELWTGTGFPAVFYLRYHLYRQYFPLMAIGTYLRKVRSQ